MQLLLAGALGVLLEAGAAEPLGPDRHGFVVVSGAEEVGRSGPTPRRKLHYYVKESFPAAGTIDTIVSTLRRHGWKAVTGEDARYESSSLDSGWSEVPEDGRTGLRLWSARWRNAGGDEVKYSLVYSSPQMASGMEPLYLSVTAWFDTKEEAARTRRWMEVESARFQRALAVVPNRTPTPCPDK